MAARDCIEAIRSAAEASGLELTPEQADDLAETLLEEVERRSRAAQARGELQGLEQSLLNAADELAQDLVQAAQIERRNRLINVVAEAELNSFASEVETRTGDPSLAVEARQVGINAPIPGARRSADTEHLALFRSYLGGMLADLRRGGEHLVTVLNSRGLDREIARELAELSKRNGEVGISGSKDAQAIARVIDKYRKLSVARENRAGAWIRPLEGYITRQTHDMHRIRRAADTLEDAGLGFISRRARRFRAGAAQEDNFRAWFDFILPKLDDRTFQGADPERFLRGAWEGLVTGRHLKAIGADETDLPIAFKGPGNLAKKASQHRVLHFRSADDWFDYNEVFGTRSLVEAVIQDLDRAARNTALMRTFGTNPRFLRDKWVEGLKDRHRGDLKKLDRLNRQTLTWQFDEVDGTSQIPVSPSLARVSGGVVALQSMAKLGGAGISALADVVFKAAELRYQGRNLLQGYADSLNDIVRLFPGDDSRMIGELLAVGMETQMGDLLSRFSSTDHIPGTLSKMTRMFFKLNLLGPITDANKRGTAMIMSRHLAMNKALPLAELDPETRRLMSLFGIDEPRWDVIRTHAVREAPDGREYVFPEGIRDIPDEALKALDPDASARRLRGLRDDLELALSSYFVDRAEFASPTPGARERAILRLGTRSGTPVGTVVRFMAQFKGFPIAVTSKAIGREIFGHGALNFREAFLEGKGDMLGLVHLVIGSVVMGYVAQSAKQLSRGLTPRDPTDPETWLSSALQGGGLGIYGDFFFGEFNRFGRSLLDTIAGPTIGEVDSLAEVWARAIRGEDAASQFMRLAVNNAPFINLFYTRVAFDYLFLRQVQEMLSPGSLRRAERRLERENRQTYFLPPPSRVIPRGGGGRLFEGVR